MNQQAVLDEKRRKVAVLSDLLQQAAKEAKDKNCNRPHFHASKKSSPTSVEVYTLTCMLQQAIEDFQYFSRHRTCIAPDPCSKSFLELRQIAADNDLGLLKLKLLGLCDRVVKRKSRSSIVYDTNASHQTSECHQEIKEKLDELCKLVNRFDPDKTNQVCLEYDKGYSYSGSKQKKRTKLNDFISLNSGNLPSSEKEMLDMLSSYSKSNVKLQMLERVLHSLSNDSRDSVLINVLERLKKATRGYLGSDKVDLSSRDVQRTLALALREWMQNQSSYESSSYNFQIPRKHYGNKNESWSNNPSWGSKIRRDSRYFNDDFPGYKQSSKSGININYPNTYKRNYLHKDEKKGYSRKLHDNDYPHKYEVENNGYPSNQNQYLKSYPLCPSEQDSAHHPPCHSQLKQVCFPVAENCCCASCVPLQECCLSPRTNRRVEYRRVRLCKRHRKMGLSTSLLDLAIRRCSKNPCRRSGSADCFGDAYCGTKNSRNKKGKAKYELLVKRNDCQQQQQFQYGQPQCQQFQFQQEQLQCHQQQPHYHVPYSSYYQQNCDYGVGTHDNGTFNCGVDPQSTMSLVGARSAACGSSYACQTNQEQCIQTNNPSLASMGIGYQDASYAEGYAQTSRLAIPNQARIQATTATSAAACAAKMSECLQAGYGGQQCEGEVQTQPTAQRSGFCQAGSIPAKLQSNTCQTEPQAETRDQMSDCCQTEFLHESQTQEKRPTIDFCVQKTTRVCFSDHRGQMQEEVHHQVQRNCSKSLARFPSHNNPPNSDKEQSAITYPTKPRIKQSTCSPKTKKSQLPCQPKSTIKSREADAYRKAIMDKNKYCDFTKSRCDSTFSADCNYSTSEDPCCRPKKIYSPSPARQQRRRSRKKKKKTIERVPSCVEVVRRTMRKAKSMAPQSSCEDDQLLASFRKTFHESSNDECSGGWNVLDDLLKGCEKTTTSVTRHFCK